MGNTLTTTVRMSIEVSEEAARVLDDLMREQRSMFRYAYNRLRDGEDGGQAYYSLRWAVSRS